MTDETERQAAREEMADHRDEPTRAPNALQAAVNAIDDRTGIARLTERSMKKVFPDHWSFFLGELALFCFVILVLTGTYLTLFFVPSAEQLQYSGPSLPLVGADVSAAFNSVVKISLEVRAGLLVRQIHHWTALVFLAAIAIHMSRVFFTGAFRKPRELNWLGGIVLLLLALAEGVSGYSLPDDLLSGIGLRIVYSAILSIPFAGPSLASLIFGGEFPTDQIISRLFVVHVLLLPGIFIAGIAVHVGLVWFQTHTMYKRRGLTEHEVVGPPFWPVQVFRSTGLFFLTFAVIAIIAGFVQINPVWIYGPYLPFASSVPAQPDWYVGWLEGALRLGLPIEIVIFGIRIPEPFIPGVLIPGALFTFMAIWPFIERRFTHDTASHNLLDFPWEAPKRTAIGAAVLTYFVILTLAGGNDVLAAYLNVPVSTITDALRVEQVAAPVVVALVVYALARSKRRQIAMRDEDEPHLEGEPLERAVDGSLAKDREAIA